ncbi:MAG: hypothetical protein ACFB02_09410 [Mastigocoleus sp.]
MSLDFSENLVEENLGQVNATTFNYRTDALTSKDDICFIEGEAALTIDQLPQSWQNIYAGTSNTKLSDPKTYVKMAQLFLYKMSHGDVDLFNSPDNSSDNNSNHLLAISNDLKPAFCKIFGTLATEALDFYGKDFEVDKYPEFDSIEKLLSSEEEDYQERKKILEIGRALFEEFGYDLPASFYHVHLAPIYREEVSEIRPLRFSEEDKNHARAWDASLHGQKVFPIQLTVQSISSKHGYFQEHGCGCNHAMTRVGATETSFDYQIRPAMRDTWIRDFIWTIWYEYAFFKFTPVTRFLVG